LALPTAAPVATPEIESAQSFFIEVGDRVVIRFGDTQNQRTFVLRQEGLDLNNGFITPEHPLGEALLTRTEDDEIEYEFDGRTRTATVLKLEKSALASASMLLDA
jgi:transcription elongation GreA/GreB family factor